MMETKMFGFESEINNNMLKVLQNKVKDLKSAKPKVKKRSDFDAIGESSWNDGKKEPQPGKFKTLLDKGALRFGNRKEKEVKKSPEAGEDSKKKRKKKKEKIKDPESTTETKSVKEHRSRPHKNIIEKIENIKKKSKKSKGKETKPETIMDSQSMSTNTTPEQLKHNKDTFTVRWNTEFRSEHDAELRNAGQLTEETTKGVVHHESNKQTEAGNGKKEGHEVKTKEHSLTEHNERDANTERKAESSERKKSNPAVDTGSVMNSRRNDKSILNKTTINPKQIKNNTEETVVKCSSESRSGNDRPTLLKKAERGAQIREETTKNSQHHEGITVGERRDQLMEKKEERKIEIDASIQGNKQNQKMTEHNAETAGRKETKENYKKEPTSVAKPQSPALSHDLKTQNVKPKLEEKANVNTATMHTSLTDIHTQKKSPALQLLSQDKQMGDINVKRGIESQKNVPIKTKTPVTTLPRANNFPGKMKQIPETNVLKYSSLMRKDDESRQPKRKEVREESSKKKPHSERNTLLTIETKPDDGTKGKKSRHRSHHRHKTTDESRDGKKRRKRKEDESREPKRKEVRDESSKKKPHSERTTSQKIGRKPDAGTKGKKSRHRSHHRHKTGDKSRDGKKRRKKKEDERRERKRKEKADESSKKKPHSARTTSQKIETKPDDRTDEKSRHRSHHRHKTGGESRDRKKKRESRSRGRSDDHSSKHSRRRRKRKKKSRRRERKEKRRGLIRSLVPEAKLSSSQFRKISLSSIPCACAEENKSAKDCPVCSQWHKEQPSQDYFNDIMFDKARLKKRLARRKHGLSKFDLLFEDLNRSFKMGGTLDMHELCDLFGRNYECLRSMDHPIYRCDSCSAPIDQGERLRAIRRGSGEFVTCDACAVGMARSYRNLLQELEYDRTVNTVLRNWSFQDAVEKRQMFMFPYPQVPELYSDDFLTDFIRNTEHKEKLTAVSNRTLTLPDDYNESDVNRFLN